MQVFILQYFTRIVKNLKKRENTENLCLIIRGSQVQALLGPRKEEADPKGQLLFFLPTQIFESVYFIISSWQNECRIL